MSSPGWQLKNDYDGAHQALVDALIEVIEAAERQLSSTGRGIEPSERLQEAFDHGRKLIAALSQS